MGIIQTVLAFLRTLHSRFEGGHWNIYTVAPDGTDKTLVTASDGDDYGAGFLADGIIACRTNRNGNQDIYTAVPEPATLSPLALGGLGALIRRRRRQPAIHTAGGTHGAAISEDRRSHPIDDGHADSGLGKWSHARAASQADVATGGGSSQLDPTGRREPQRIRNPFVRTAKALQGKYLRIVGRELVILLVVSAQEQTHPASPDKPTTRARSRSAHGRSWWTADRAGGESGGSMCRPVRSTSAAGTATT